MNIPDGWRQVDKAIDPRWYQHSTGAVVRWITKPDLNLTRSGWVAWRSDHVIETDYVGVYKTLREATTEATR